MSETMKTARSLSVIMALGLFAVTARAGFIDEIKESLAGPEIEGTPEIHRALLFCALVPALPHVHAEARRVV